MQLTFVIVFVAFLSAQVFAQHKAEKVQKYDCGKRLRVKSSQIDRAVNVMDTVFNYSMSSCSIKPNLLNKCCKICVNYLKYQGTHFHVSGNNEILLKKLIRFKIFRKKPLNLYYAVAQCSRVYGCLFLGIIRRPLYNSKEIKCSLMLKDKPASMLPIGFPQPATPPDFRE
ncbi:BgTH12-03120 [Blumeria graminis f. sp. triticale]|uniref:BgtE-5924 n=3 Tax=Blumeria graminis TaxID=34373 RepID=A0A9X9MK34_BLUGR|nr:putative secreted effector protein [Blumeria graminis f. sp. tritici 96224]CAD6503456.1 BgTH12-03120 [Blumeria graminis f. sp. triticale]VDB89547.1 BgtE-5924 [Blumeria graminis f. sp. tritici]